MKIRLAAVCLFLALPAHAQSMSDMPGMDHGAMDHSMMGHDMAGMNMPMPETMPKMMKGALGDYAMMRDGSGTAWLPDSTPMQGKMLDLGNWSGMAQGFVTGVYDHQGGPRGAEQFFSQSMGMLMAQNQIGPGLLTLRGMASLDAFMGNRGYPLLLQTGETANGVDHLVDRQHPHDLLMELAASYAVKVADTASAFVYAGYPGEPALGPGTFMHRLSGWDNPAAPITHHWLDSTHITFGVITGGLTTQHWKIEASAFHGREPDQHRWDLESFTLDSASARVTFNPDENWSLQASYGFLKSPEQLSPADNQHRTTASAIYNRAFDGGNWQTTLAFGRNDTGHHGLNAFLAESAVKLGQHTVFARAENADKDELFEAPDPLAHRTFGVTALSLGYVYDVPLADRLAIGLGAVGTLNLLPSSLRAAYGDTPTSTMLFTRLILR